MLLTLACSPPSDSGSKAPQGDPPAGEAAPAQSSLPEIRGEVVHYQADGVTLTGYIAYDERQEGTRPGVLVVHEWWGHNEYARERARMLAEMGYTALALDMYGDGKLAEHPEDAQKFMMEVTGNLDVVVDRFQTARGLLEQHATTDPEKTAAIGYCFGGAVVLHMARLGADLDAVASFHGDLAARTEIKPGTITARILVAHGADDPFVPQDQLEAFRQEMADAEVDMKFVAYPGAVHSFTNPGATAVGERFEMPLAYNREADLESWNELESLLAETFSGD
jgi:dienelactone hydrolase